MNGRGHRRGGFTYVEMLISIVIIAIAVTGVLSVMNLTTGRSADPMIRQQAVAIAEAYLEEITLKPFTDPDGSDTGETRPTYDDLFDYDGLDDTGAEDQEGNPIDGLEPYRVEVSVVSQDLKDIDSTDAARIDVQVTHTDVVDITLSAYRTDY